jgi:endonuclease/exonuclease/phosphatase family metal-dependent hydrolase
VASEQEAAALRVLTYNIHHGEGTDGNIDLGRTAAVIRGADADLIALQEVDRDAVRTGTIDQLSELERLTGMRGVFGKAMDFQGGAYGVAILSRLPITSSENQQLPGAPGREPRTALSVDVATRSGLRVHFTSTHLDQGRDSESRAAQVRFLTDSMPHGGEPSLLAGDFNSSADTDVIATVRSAWTDLFTAPIPVGPSGAPRRRVDYVFGRPGSGWRTLDSGYIDDRLASDHRPVIVSLEWRGSTQ